MRHDYSTLQSSHLDALMSLLNCCPVSICSLRASYTNLLRIVRVEFCAHLQVSAMESNCTQILLKGSFHM